MKIYLLITALLGIFTTITIFYLIRKDHLHIRYAFGWILIAIVIGVFGLRPQLIDVLSDNLGISYPPILAVIVAICFMLLKLLLNDLESSKQERRIIRLTQRLAILEAEKLEAEKHHKKSNLNNE